MNLPPLMTEATRLTVRGKLSEATELIQCLLNRNSKSASSSTRRDDRNPLAQQLPSPRPQLRTPNAKPRSGLGKTLRDLRNQFGSLDQGLYRSPPTAPVLVPSGATFEEGTYANAAGARGFKLYVPSRSSGRLPLIVMLHGCTQSPDDFALGTRMNLHAEEQGFLALYPAQAPAANAKRCWNWFNPRDQRRGEGEPSLIAGITQQIMRDYPVDTSRVYIAGLSAGGAAAAIVASAYPDIYAAVGVHSGLPVGAANDIPTAFAAMGNGAPLGATGKHSVPTIVFHGDQDRTVHPCNGEAVIAQATASFAGHNMAICHGQSSGGQSYRRADHYNEANETICEHWIIHGGGHAWSGGSPPGSFTDPRGPDATREMLRFFFEHPLKQ